MLRPVLHHNPIFADKSRKGLEYSRHALVAGVTGLMLQDIVWLKFYPKTPKLYKSGVYYKQEKGREDWLTIPYVIDQGFGDCEDLAAWRAAELRVQGIDAKPFVKIRVMPNGKYRAHALIILPNGKLEDPSKKLGM